MDAKIRIQRGIPMPATKPRGMNGGKSPEYPWDQMQVGDSFLFPESVGRASHSAAIHASKQGRKFVARKTDDGYRCWRIK